MSQERPIAVDPLHLDAQLCFAVYSAAHAYNRLYRPLLGPEDRRPVARQATFLAIADEIERRIPPGKALPVACEERKRQVIVHAPLFDGYRQGLLADRFHRAFGKRLVFEP